MKTYYELEQKSYPRILFRKMLRSTLWNPILIVVYLEFWQLIYNLSKYGDVKRNFKPAAVCFVILIFFLGQLIGRYIIKRRKPPIRKQEGISFTPEGIAVVDSNGELLRTINWTSIKRIKEAKKRYEISINNGSFFTIPKKIFEGSSGEEDRELLLGKVKPKKILPTLIVAIIWLVITLSGGFAVGRMAVNYNGKLAWFLQDLKTTRTVKMEKANIYDMGLSGILELADKKADFLPYLNAGSLTVTYAPDGTIETFESYIYGYNLDFKLTKGYLLFYDASKVNKMTIHIQNFEGTAQGSAVYEVQENIEYINNIFDRASLKDIARSYGAESYGITFRNSDGEPRMRLYERSTDYIIKEFYLKDYMTSDI